MLITVVWASNKAGTYVPFHVRAGSMTVDAFVDAARKAISLKSRELTTEVKDR